MIRPGEKIVILVQAGSSKEDATAADPATEKRVSKRPGSEIPKPEIPKGVPGRLKYETYRIKRGDSIGALAITRYELSRKQLHNQYYKLFMECNPSITNPDRIFAGQRVRLPLFPPVRVAPLKNTPDIPDLDSASDGRVSINPVNSGIKIPDPVVSPKKTSDRPPEQPRVTARPKPPKKKPAPAGAKKPKKRPKTVAIKKKSGVVQTEIPYKPHDIGHIFTQMGSDWIDSGEHFIPLKSGGQINLKASSYPVIRLNDGVTVILDLTGKLPSDMSRFIQTTWSDYRIVHIHRGDDLRSALDKILKACGFSKAVKTGKPLLLGKDIRLEIGGDWILNISDEDAKAKFMVLNLVPSPQGYVPETIKKHLKTLQVHLIEYPPGTNPLDARAPQGKIYRVKDRSALIGALLKLTGHPFSEQEQIPAFMGQKEDFKLVVNADFFVRTGRGNMIFDLTGLDPQIISLLKKRRISVLSLIDVKDPLVITNRILDQLQVKGKKGPHKIGAIHETGKKKVTITIPGIVFSGVDGNKVLLTPMVVPENISAFLLKKNYRLLLLSGFPPGASPIVGRK